MSRRLSAAIAVASSIWGAALSLAAVPIYLSKMGIEAYGLIGFLITSQAVLQVLDLGLAPAINREVARSKTLGDLDSARTLLRTLSRLYWFMAAAIAVVFCAWSPLIASTWLSASRLSSSDITQSLMLMGVLIATRWPIAVYQNTLIGGGRLGPASVLTATMATLSVGASIAVVTLGAPRPAWLFAVQTAVSFLHVLLVRALAWRSLDGPQGAVVNFRSVRRLWSFGVGMGGVVLTGIVLTQLDKLLLSKMLPLSAFGEYMLAATVVGGLAVLVSPLFNTIYPEFSGLVARGQTSTQINTYHRDTRMFATAFFTTVSALAIYAQDIVTLWTGNISTAIAVAPIIAILCIGTVINGIMYFPYSIQLAFGITWIPLLINSVLLVVLVPLMIVLTMNFGGLGGAIAWAGLELIYLVFGTYMTHRHVKIGSALAWLWRGIAGPFAITTAVTLLIRPAILLAPTGSLLRVSLVASGVLFTILIGALSMPDTRSRLLGRYFLRRPPPKIHEYPKHS